MILAAPSFRTESPVLLSVHNLHEEIVAGAGGATCAVRTLDGLSCHVRVGELVVLQGGVASGANSLLDVFAGLRTRVRGVRQMHPRAQIRRGAISTTAARAIVSAWSNPHRVPAALAASARRPDSANATSDAGAPLAFLLRVHTRRDAVPALEVMAWWRDWAVRVRARNVAVVLAVHLAFDNKERTEGPEASHEQLQVREPQRMYGSERVRVLTLRAGRIIATPARESRAPITDSGGSSAPNVCHPLTTTSIAP